MTHPKEPAPTDPAPQEVPSVAQLPVTRAMLLGVRDELRARIDGTNARIEAPPNEALAHVFRRSLGEDQEGRNRAVLELVQCHNAYFERLEAGLDETRGMIREILDAVRQRPST